MCKNVLLFLAPLLLSIGCTPSLKSFCIASERNGMKAANISNGILSANVIPEASGICTDIHIGENALMNVFSSNSSKTEFPFAGFRTELLGASDTPRFVNFRNAQVMSDGAVVAKLFRNNWNRRNLKFEKTIIIPSNDTRISMDVTVTNTGDKKENIALRDIITEYLGQEGNNAVFIFPVKGKVEAIRKEKVSTFTHDQIIRLSLLNQPESVTQLAPSESWFAHHSQGKILMVIRFPHNLTASGFFRTSVTQNNFISCEGIHGYVMLSPNASTSVHTECLFFEGMNDIQGLCEDIAIHSELSPQNDKLIVTIASTRTVNVGNLLLDGGETVKVGTVKRGHPIQLSVSKPKGYTPEKTLYGSLSEISPFILLPLHQDKASLD